MFTFGKVNICNVQFRLKLNIEDVHFKFIFKSEHV